ncbi:MAG: HAMP domain-containing histidine kinase [Gammaproteobacteria bacterium]|nr:HAMP domain-containing histidine kinase [Gammaproteobacteria bacterium]
MKKAINIIENLTNKLEVIRQLRLGFWIVVSRIHRSFSESVEYSLPHLKTIGYAGLIGFPLYHYIWLEMFPQYYENIALRLVGAVLCGGFIFIRYWPGFMRRYVAVYWFITFLYSLPFFFTFMLLMNQGNTVWAMSTMAALTLLILIAHDWVLVIIMFSLGSISAFFAYYLATGSTATVDQYLVQLPIYLFLVVAGSIFNYKSIRLKQEKLKVLATVGTDIAHELRTPLLTIKTNVDGLGKYMPVLFEAHQLARQRGLTVADLPQNKLNALSGAVDRAQTELGKANTIIDMLLMNFGKARIDTDLFEHFWMAGIVDEALERYPFQSQYERSKIIWQSTGNFRVWGSDILLVHVLFNLFKNALYYVNELGRGTISISLENGRRFNVLRFRDTARGIPYSELPNIFDYLYSGSRKPGRNTGVGLAYCKKVMEYFRGDIICESIPGEYTEFQLRFPAV